MNASTTKSADPFDLAGRTLAERFLVEKEVAEGGFGVVYKAQQVALERPVALKVLKIPPGLGAAQQASFQENFAAEGRIIAKIRHTNIVEVYDFGATPTTHGSMPIYWMALEWLDGETLEGFLKEQAGRPLSPPQALHLLEPVIRAIAFAHVRGVAHRDLKPANVMIVKGPDGPVPKVLDFGISKIMEPGVAIGSASHTTSKVAAFSPAYAAPEQVTMGRSGPWTDVHALGLMLTELLTGTVAFQLSAEGGLAPVIAEERPTPRTKGFDVGAWEPVLAKALSLHARDRQQNAGELLTQLLARVPEAQPASAHDTISDEDPTILAPSITADPRHYQSKSVGNKSLGNEPKVISRIWSYLRKRPISPQGVRKHWIVPTLGVVATVGIALVFANYRKPSIDNKTPNTLLGEKGYLQEPLPRESQLHPFSISIQALPVSDAPAATSSLWNPQRPTATRTPSTAPAVAAVRNTGMGVPAGRGLSPRSNGKPPTATVRLARPPGGNHGAPKKSSTPQGVDTLVDPFPTK